MSWTYIYASVFYIFQCILRAQIRSQFFVYTRDIKILLLILKLLKIALIDSNKNLEKLGLSACHIQRPYVGSKIPAIMFLSSEFCPKKISVRLCFVEESGMILM